MTRPRIAVVGTGLTALLVARQLDAAGEVLLVRPGLPPGVEGPAAGGGGDATPEEDLGADGPWGLPARIDPDAQRLASELLAGLDRPGPARWWRTTGPVQVWADGHRRTLPRALVDGDPVSLPALAASRVLSPVGLGTLATGRLRPQRHLPGDRSVASLVDDRFGIEVRDRLVAPWLAAATGGDPTVLSATCELPSVPARPMSGPVTGGSLPAGLLGPRGVLEVPGGWPALVAALRSARPVLPEEEPVLGIAFDAYGPVLEQPAGARPVDAVVLAVAVPDAIRLLHRSAPGVARELVGIEHREVVEVVLDHEASAVPPDAMVGALLVPSGEGRRIVWMDQWTGDGPAPAPGHVRSRVLVAAGPVPLPDLDAGEGRGSVGGGSEASPDTSALIRQVDAELRRCVGITRPATRSWSRTWVLPQRTVGHPARLDRLVHQLDQVPPGLHLGGAALQGIGPAARLHDAGRLAHEVRWQLSQRPRRPDTDAPATVAGPVTDDPTDRERPVTDGAATRVEDERSR